MKIVYTLPTAIQLGCSSAIETVWQTEQESLETGSRIHQTEVEYSKEEIKRRPNYWMQAKFSTLLILLGCMN